MATRDELVTYVFSRLGVSSSRDSFQALVEGHLERHYHRAVRNFMLNMDDADLALVQDDPYVDLPDDFMRARTVRVGTRTLRQITQESLADRAAAREEASASTATPGVYVFMAPNRLYIDPVPTETDNAGGKLFYVARPAAWTSGDDTPDCLPTEYHDLLAEETIYRMAQDQEEFSTHAAAAAATAARLRAELSLEIKLRDGDGSHRVFRAHYG